MEFHEKSIYLYIIGHLQLAYKRVLSGLDCLNIETSFRYVLAKLPWSLRCVSS